MAIKLSLQFKLLIAVALVIILALLSLAYLSINSQKKLFYESFQDLAITLAQALDAGISSEAELSDTSKLQANIYKMIWLNSDITKISISLPTKNGLKVVVSNDTFLVGSLAVPESISSYRKGVILTRTLIEPDGTEVLRVITPVHVGGQRVGTYDIRLSLDSLEKVISETQRQFLLGAIVAILVIISALFLLMRITVINPVKNLQKGIKMIGSGKLDYRIRIKRSDEIGDLASGLNEMAEKLKDKTEALEKEKISLEVKVEKRTEELQGRINELEKLHKFTVGRELKMIEMKKKIQELEKKIKRT